ncbi:cell envelope integrity protein TolA [Enterobacter hormaechei]|uniref:cell envelope integrity protein TolA n=1 Tax=Enterobacter hormaechei TaxID=158836 RepID=UPI002FCFA0C8
MRLSKWKLMALVIPAAWTSISYAYDWNDDVTQRVQTLIENAANKYVQGDYDSYNSDTETAINLLLTIEPQPQSPEQIDARKIQAAQLVDETVKKEIISLEQSIEANRAKADAEYQKMQSMSKEEKEQAAAKAAKEAADAKALAEKKAASAYAEAIKAKAASEKAEAASGVDDLFGDLGSGKSVPKTEASPTTERETSSASSADISSYVNKIVQKIRDKLNFDDFKGKRCDVKIYFNRDGFITNYMQEGGDDTFCNYVTSAIKGINKLPAPPSDAVYDVINGATLSFKSN